MATPTLQSVATSLTRAAIFLVLTISPRGEAEHAVKDLFADLSALRRTVGFRNFIGHSSCVPGLESAARDRLFPGRRPKKQHPFVELHGVHHAVFAPGDLVFHIRAVRQDMCFEMAALIMGRLRAFTTVVAEVQSFKYFDDRNLIGFGDGTQNPEGAAVAAEAALIGDEDADFAGGSSLVIQKYLHDLDAWNTLPIETQEKIVGRKKLSNVELADSAKSPYAYNILNTVTRGDRQTSILPGR